MPYVDTVGDVIRMTSAAFLATAQVQEFNLHYICSISGGGDSRPALAAANDAAVAANLIPMMAADAVHFGTKVSIIRSLHAFMPTITNPNTAGTGAGNIAPTQCRGLISLRTDTAGRKGRGRLYIYTPVQGQLGANSKWSGAYNTALVNYGAAMITPILVGGTTWSPIICEFSRTKPRLLLNTTLVTGALTTNNIATQRRSGDFGRLNAPPW
jgi:hypothetical protein